MPIRLLAMQIQNENTIDIRILLLHFYSLFSRKELSLKVSLMNSIIFNQLPLSGPTWKFIIKMLVENGDSRIRVSGIMKILTTQHGGPGWFTYKGYYCKKIIRYLEFHQPQALNGEIKYLLLLLFILPRNNDFSTGKKKKYTEKMRNR